MDGPGKFYKLRVSMPVISSVGTRGYTQLTSRLPVALSTDFAGTTNAFLAKYNSTSVLLWTARIVGSGTATTQIYSTATDSTGAIYGAGVAGVLSGGGSSSILFYNADGTYASTVVTNNYNATNPTAAFLVKYNSGGVFQWCGYVMTFGTPGANQFGYGIAVDPSDGIYMSGIAGGSGQGVRAYNSSGTLFATSFSSGSGVAGDAFLVKYNTSGSVQWLTRVSQTTVNDFGYGLAADSTGVYMTGQIGTGSVSAYNASGTVGGSLTTTSADGLIVKYTLAGVVAWLTYISSTAADAAWGCALDTTGSLYVTGQYGAATMTAYSAGGAAFGTTLASLGAGDSFLVKYNSSGVVQWVARQGGTAADIAYGIATDSSNNVYMIGAQGAAVFTAYSSNGVAFGTTIPSRGAGDAFVIQYTSSGTVQWITQIGGTALDRGFSLVTDASANVYCVVTTASSSLLVYNSSGSTFATLSPTTNPATALIQYNSSGTGQRAVVLNSSTTTYGVCRDASVNLILGGTTTANIARLRGPSTTVAFSLATSAVTGAYLVKYSPNGVPLWGARITAATSGLRGIATDSSRNIYVAGGAGASGTITFFNASGVSFGTLPQERGFVVKYNPAGAIQWVASFTAVNGTGGTGIAVDSTGAVYVTGIGAPTTGSLTVFNANGTTGLTRTSSFGSRTGTDGILIKYSSSGVAQWISNLNDTGTVNSAFRSITIASDDSIFVAGSNNSLTSAPLLFNADGTNGLGGTNGFGAWSSFIIKYTTSGALVWRTGTASGGGTGGGGLGVTCDATGNSYLSFWGGSSTQTTGVRSVGPGATTTLFRTISAPTVGSTDAYVVKYNSSGIGQWVTSITSTDGDFTYGLAYDPTTASLFVVGVSQGSGTAAVSFPWMDNATLRFSPLAKAGNVGFLAKYSPLTDTFPPPTWALRLDSSSTSSTDTVWQVAVDRRGNIYISCDVNSIAAATGIVGDVAVANYGTTAGTNVTLACFSPTGMLRWFQSIRGTTTFQRGLCTATDSDCNVLVGGDTNGQTVNIYAKA